jgi:pimeloyl-ACP methyl ester carboxylesterase
MLPLALAATTSGIFGSKVPPMKSVLPGEAKEFNFKGYRIFYKSAGNPQKPPLVFVHGIGAGASSFEWRYNFEPLSAHFQVFAYDLLGFGLSQRPDLEYSLETYLKLLSAFLQEVVQQPAYVAAVSVTAGHALQVALRQPELIKKLVLVVPAGANNLTNSKGPNITGKSSYPFLRLPGVGKNLFSVFSSRFGISSFMQNFMYYDPKFITPELADYYYIASHQPGAEHAPLAFFANRLNAEIGESFSKLTQPTLLVWGKEPTVSRPQEGYRLLKQNARAQMVLLEKTKLACNEEGAEAFNRVVTAFLGNPESKITLEEKGFKLAR